MSQIVYDIAGLIVISGIALFLGLWGVSLIIRAVKGWNR